MYHLKIFLDETLKSKSLEKNQPDFSKRWVDESQGTML
jgi:hypothetical protein